MPLRRWARILLFAVVPIPSTATLGAEAASEYEVKAAFLLNFARLTHWPDNWFSSPDAPIVICVFGSNPFQGALVRLMSDQSIENRSLRLVEVEALVEVNACHMIFVPHAETSRFVRILPSLDASLLVVGESEGFAKRGAIINLYKEERRIRFEVNRNAAERAGLSLSSRLLRLARLVGEEDN